MELYTYYRSTSSYRVRIALALKGLDVTAVPVNLLVPPGGANRQPDYLAINPQGRVPALRTDEGELLIQSPAIIEYLEERYPQAPLLSKTWRRAPMSAQWRLSSAAIFTRCTTPVPRTYCASGGTMKRNCWSGSGIGSARAWARWSS